MLGRGGSPVNENVGIAIELARTLDSSAIQILRGAGTDLPKTTRAACRVTEPEGQINSEAQIPLPPGASEVSLRHLAANIGTMLLHHLVVYAHN
jgi:hypothetical protein